MMSDIAQSASAMSTAVLVVLSIAASWAGIADGCAGHMNDSGEEDDYVDVEDSDEESHREGESLREVHASCIQYGDVMVRRARQVVDYSCQDRLSSSISLSPLLEQRVSHVFLLQLFHHHR